MHIDSAAEFLFTYSGQEYNLNGFIWFESVLGPVAGVPGSSLLQPAGGPPLLPCPRSQEGKDVVHMTQYTVGFLLFFGR